MLCSCITIFVYYIIRQIMYQIFTILIILYIFITIILYLFITLILYIFITIILYLFITIILYIFITIILYLFITIILYAFLMSIDTDAEPAHCCLCAGLDVGRDQPLHLRLQEQAVQAGIQKGIAGQKSLTWLNKKYRDALKHL